MHLRGHFHGNVRCNRNFLLYTLINLDLLWQTGQAGEDPSSSFSPPCSGPVPKFFGTGPVFYGLRNGFPCANAQ